MSCHSSHNLGPLAAARAVDGLDDQQISKIFHDLKRQVAEEHGLEVARRIVPADEVHGYLSHLRERVASDWRIPDKKRARILDRISATITSLENDGTPDVDEATFSAWQRLPFAAARTGTALDHALHRASNRLGLNHADTRELFDQWRGDPDTPDIDLHDPEHPYLSEYAFVDPDLPNDTRSKIALRRLAWETYLSEPAPVFVYGTLRTGQHNSALLEDGYVSKASSEMPGIALHGHPRAGFPFAMTDPSAITRGELVRLRDDANGAYSRMALDWLEGFSADDPDGSHYARTLRDATIAGPDGNAQRVRAWVYVATPRTRERMNLSARTRIPSGDWFDYPGVQFNPAYATRAFAQ